MREKLKIIIKVVIKVIMPIASLASLATLIYTIVYNCINNYPDFFKVNVIEVITIVVAIVFAYYYVERKNDGRKQKEVIENSITKIQKLIYDPEIYNVVSKDICNSLTRSIKIRKIKNLIKYLEDYSKKFEFEKLLDDISRNIKEYQVTTEIMSQDNDFVPKSINNVKRILETLDDNLEELVHKIYL